MARIRLSDAIRELRAELSRARDDEADDDLRFEVKSIVLEVEVTAEREAAVEGKVNWWVFSGGVADKRGDARGQKITLTLSPKDAEGRPLNVHQQQPERAG